MEYGLTASAEQMQASAGQMQASVIKRASQVAQQSMMLGELLNEIDGLVDRLGERLHTVLGTSAEAGKAEADIAPALVPFAEELRDRVDVARRISRRLYSLIDCIEL